MSGSFCYPRVMACGYQSVFIEKSGQKFPAWLVDFGPEQDQAAMEEGQLPLLCDMDSSTKKIYRRYRWRSKHDFWKLSRMTTKATSAPNKNSSSCKSLCQLPKSSFTRLVEEAPWRRHLEAAQSDSALDRMLGETSKAATNNWNIRFSKSVNQLDQFLQSIPLALDQAVHVFAIYNVDESSDKVAGTDVWICLKQAWEEFCRGSDVSALLSVKNTMMKNFDPEIFAPTGSGPGNSSHVLGQYFCSRDNAQLLVTTFLRQLRELLVPSAASKIKRKILIVEPSCGHGDVLHALINELETADWMSEHYGCNDEGNQRRNNEDISISILGFDIDQRAVNYCRHRFAERKPKRGSITISFQMGDFLATNPASLTSYVATVEIDTKTTVVMIGGPPYSAKAEKISHDKAENATSSKNSPDMNRDMPLRFVEHAVQVWKAQVITFLMPQRYATIFPRKIFQTEDDPSSSQPNKKLKRQSPPQSSLLPPGYRYDSAPLSDSIFFIQGRPVRQPSIVLSCWNENLPNTNIQPA